MGIVITGTGSYIPKNKVNNSDFLGHEFYDKKGEKIHHPNKEIIEKFKAITGIEERRYGDDHQVNSDLATLAARKAIKDSGINPEELDYIIVAHNFGNIEKGSFQVTQIPSIACLVKHNLKIKNNSCVAYDLIFGCPGWLEGMVQAQAFIRAGMAKKCLVIGSEMLSRIVDPHDRDSMIFADGAGAVVLEEKETAIGGVLMHESASYTYHEALYLSSGCSYKKGTDDTEYIKMLGRRIYNFALIEVPQAMKVCLDKSGKSITDIKKIFIHQANEKMDSAMVERFYKLYDLPVPENVMPMNIHKLGNSSVATLPTLLDMVKKGQLKDHEVQSGDTVLFASVGAGMNINALVYQF